MRPLRVRSAAWLLGACLLASGASAAIVEEIVVSVNGEIVTMTEVQAREREIESALYANLSGDELDQALAKFRDEMLVDMVNEKLLFQRAVRMGLDLEQVYQSSLESIMAQNNIQSKEELVALLEQQGMSVKEFRENLLKYNVPDIMINLEVRRKISASDAEVRDYYDAHKEEFSVPEYYTFRELAFLLSEHSPDEARELAREVLAKVEAGDDFMTLVRTYSEAPSREQAGLVENLELSKMSPTILEALQALEPGEVSQPIELGRAIMILKLEIKQESLVEPLEAVRPNIEAAVKQGKYDAELETFMRGMWADSHIKTNPKYEKQYLLERYR